MCGINKIQLTEKRMYKVRSLQADSKQ